MHVYLLYMRVPRALKHRMSRDQRMADNWALLYALDKAAEHSAPCAVAFNLVSSINNHGSA